MTSFRTGFAVLAALAAAALLAAGPAAAQAPSTGQRAPQPAAVRPPAAEADAMTPAQRVDELARVLGRAHYLRVLCNGEADQTWRSAMLGLLDLEAARGSPRRAALVQTFNDGYRYEEERFPDCTPPAREASRVLSAQGKRLADALAARFRQ